MESLIESLSLFSMLESEYGLLQSGNTVTKILATIYAFVFMPSVFIWASHIESFGEKDPEKRFLNLPNPLKLGVKVKDSLYIFLSFIIMISPFIYLGFIWDEGKSRADHDHSLKTIFNITLNQEQRSTLNKEVYLWLKHKDAIGECKINDCNITLTKEQIYQEEIPFELSTIREFYNEKKAIIHQNKIDELRKQLESPMLKTKEQE